MRVRNDWRRLSVATLLLCLFAAFAVSPPEYHRPNSGNRPRTSRAARAGDCDKDHSLGAVDLSYDLDSADRGNNRPLFESLLPPGALQRVVLPSAGRVNLFSPRLLAAALSPLNSGRSPPLG